MNGGSQICTMYLAVECTSQCVYRIQIDNISRLNKSVNATQLPAYLTTEMYYTGQVKEKQWKYFYIPVTKQTGDMVIYLNKTSNLKNNGDSMVLLAFNNDTEKKKIDNWVFPSFI